jgi:flagellar M-ring protein FliF
MPPQIRAALTRLKDFVTGFSAAQKTIALLAIAGLVLGGVALTSWLGKPTMTPLFSGLQAADASKVTDQLKASGVTYELTDGGGTVMVPEGQVYAERLKAAAAGLPSDKTTTGYSLLDNMGVTSSEFQQNATYKRAMEGELGSTISAMNGVKLASVKLAIPKATVFTDAKAEPTASVFIETSPGSTLSQDQVQAIVHLTSASVDGLKPVNVAVIDADGATLSAVGTGTTGSVNKQSSDYEKQVRTNVQSILDRVVGAGNATVAVSADMDTQSGTKVDETFTQPEKAPALSESTDKQDYTGTGGNSAGVLGPDNIAVPGGTVAGGAGAGGNGTFSSEKATKNNAVNKTTQTTNIPSGVLKRQTVSVAVNSGVPNVDMARINALVAAAAGINAGRGDVVTVESVAFDQSAANAAKDALAAAEAEEAAKAAAGFWTNVILALSVLLLILIGLLMYARKNRKQKRELVDLGEQLDPVMPLDLAPEAPALTAVPVSVLEIPPLEEEVTDAKQKRAQIDQIANTDPDRIATFMRSMLDERQDA